MTTAQQFWNKVARRYAAAPIRDQATYEAWLGRVIEHLGPQDRVLELGCGTGTTAVRLAPSVGTLLASDISDEMIAIAAEKPEAVATENLRFMRADPFDDKLDPGRNGAAGGYDAVLAFNFLHLVDDPDAVLDRVHAMVKPGGLYISKTACLAGKAWLFGPMIAIMRLFGKAPGVRMLSVKGLDARLARAGFEIIEARTIGTTVVTRFVVARKV